MFSQEDDENIARVTTDFDAREIRFFRNLEAKSLRHAQQQQRTDKAYKCQATQSDH